MDIDKKVVKVLSKSFLKSFSHTSRYHLIQRSFTRIRHENKVTSYYQEV